MKTVLSGRQAHQDTRLTDASGDPRAAHVLQNSGDLTKKKKEGET